MSENPGHPTCHLHPGVVLVCPACQGAKGGRQSSPRKAKAARKNAQRPRPNRKKAT